MKINDPGEALRIRYKEIAQALARGYCHPSTEHLELDSSLITAMAHEITILLETKKLWIDFNND